MIGRPWMTLFVKIDDKYKKRKEEKRKKPATLYQSHHLFIQTFAYDVSMNSKGLVSYS